MRINGSEIIGFIPAAGRASRQGPLCYKLPKMLLPLGQKRIGDGIVESMRDMGLDRVYITGSPQENSDQIERHYNKSGVFGIACKVINEVQRRDTLGSLVYIMKTSEAKLDDVVIMVPSDKVFSKNLNLKNILDAHFATGAAITMVGYHLPWSSNEWGERSFATIQYDGMPEISRHSDRNYYESEAGKFLADLQGKSTKVAGFHEKQKREKAPSNVIYTGILLIKASVLMAIEPFVTSPKARMPFCNDGLHALPVFAGRFREFEDYSFKSDFSKFCKLIKSGAFPLFSYLLPLEGFYWRDISNPLRLMRANMNLLDGKIDIHFNETFQHREPWGWMGNYGTRIDQPEFIGCADPSDPKKIGAMIGNHVVVRGGVRIKRSIICDHVEIKGGATIDNSIIFPGSSDEKSVIDGNRSLINCIYLRGDLSAAADGLSDSIVIRPPKGRIAIYDLNGKFGVKE